MNFLKVVDNYKPVLRNIYFWGEDVISKAGFLLFIDATLNSDKSPFLFFPITTLLTS
ncbi:MAG TPA: hypothetical protein VK941_10275 [Gillisia sp.]|nr:hypothetical protein [Gillisia sp.]